MSYMRVGAEVIVQQRVWWSVYSVCVARDTVLVWLLVVAGAARPAGAGLYAARAS